jgi:hypothetical protein
LVVWKALTGMALVAALSLLVLGLLLHALIMGLASLISYRNGRVHASIAQALSLSN